MLLLQLLENREPVGIGQLHVHHHEVRTPLLDLSDGGGAGCRGANLVLLLEQVGQQGSNIRIVVDDQDGPAVSQSTLLLGVLGALTCA